MRRRRVLLTTMGGAVAVWPFAASAQPPNKSYRIAIVNPSAPLSDFAKNGGLPVWQTLFKDLRMLGYEEGRNLTVDRYSGEGRTEHYAELARQVVLSKPDLAVVISTILVKHFRAASGTIPIVGLMADPVAWGLAESIARPGGNVTGISVETGLGEIWGKRLELLKLAVPGISKVGWLAPQSAWKSPDAVAIQGAAQKVGASLIGPPLMDPVDGEEYRRVFVAMSRAGVDGLLVGLDAESFTNRRIIVGLAEQHRLPAMYPFYESAEVGGLIAYAYDPMELWHRFADPIDQILKGTNPGEIPIYEPTRLKLIVNMKTAKTLDITIPSLLLARADEIVE